MKLAYLSSSKIPSLEANSIHVMRMCSALVRAKHEVILIAEPNDVSGEQDIWRHYGLEKTFSIEYVRRPKLGRIGSVVYGARTALRMRNVSADLLYGRCPHGLAWSSLFGQPFVYEAHALPYGFFRRRLEQFLFQRPNFRHLVVISAALKRAYLDSMPELDAKSVIVAHDGADVNDDVVYGSDDYHEQQRAVLKVGYAGSLYRGKGMEIVAALAEAAPEHEYHVVGGNGPVDKWRARVGERVIFHGHVCPSAVIKFLSRFDVLLLPPLRRVEAAGGRNIAPYMSPLKLFEYMAARRPIIASKLPVIEEVLEHERTALMAEPGDIMSWAHALRKLARDGALRQRLADSAFKLLQKNFTWSARVEKVLGDLDPISDQVRR